MILSSRTILAVWILLIPGFLFFGGCSTVAIQDPAYEPAPPAPGPDESVFFSRKENSSDGNEGPARKQEKKEEPKSSESTSPPPGGKRISDDTPDENGKPVRTDFYAGTLVRETVKNQDGTETVRIALKGGATILHNQVVLRSPLISIEGGDRGKLRGGVSVNDREHDMRFTSERADYYRSRQEVTLTGKPYMRVKQENGHTAHITCNLIRQDMAEGMTFLQGDVRIIHENTTILADTGIYRNDTKTFELQKNPVVFSPDSYLTGESIKYLMADRILMVDQKVSMVARTENPSEEKEKKNQKNSSDSFPTLEEYAKTGGRAFVSVSSMAKEKPEKKDGEKVKTIHYLSTDQMIYTMEKEDRKAHLELTGNVNLTRESFQLRAPYLQSAGENMELLVADRGVELEDRESGYYITGRILSFHQKEQVLRLEEDARMEFYDTDDGSKKGTMTGAVIVSDLENEITRARGNIRIKNDEFEATAETAYYDRSVGIVILEGNPGLTRGKSTVNSERILIYPDKGRVLLLNGIRGSFSH